MKRGLDLTGREPVLTPEVPYPQVFTRAGGRTQQPVIGSRGEVFYRIPVSDLPEGDHRYEENGRVVTFGVADGGVTWVKGSLAEPRPPRLDRRQKRG